jgi:hypothetical protein
VHHVDHVFPKTLMHKPKLKAAGFDDQAIDVLQGQRDLLPNLQLLEGPQNIAKSGQDPAGWSSAEFPDSTKLGNYLSRNALPESLPASAEAFTDFFVARRELLGALIKKVVIS